MRNLVFVAVCLLGFCAVSVAQEVPQFEVFGGWNIILPEEEVPVDFLSGWEGTFTVNANEYASAVIDVSGAYTSWEENVIGMKSIHSFMAGPQFRLAQVNETFVPFIRALFGLSHVRFGDVVIEGEEEDIPLNDEGQLNQNGFAMAFGGGLDININDRISVRPAQIEFMTVRLEAEGHSEFVNNTRFAAGVIIKIGER
jgi:opacity protein-like surface antigen